ncbi:GNAT family N-acetyltransferase [Candidatus Fermentibacteria bacterium]|nr:GNAT family N-acetyltransferase [Candidatus Fermentibacteria bacterium]
MIRTMRLSDYPALRNLWAGFPGTAVTAADEPDGFAAFLERNGPHCLVAVEDGRLVGSVMAGHDTRRGYIYHLAVSTDMQGRGTGRALMEEVERSLLKAGIEKIHLFIYVDNPARCFYERLGWQYRTDIAVMSKILRKPGMV